MNAGRVLALWRKDLALGPRSPLLLYAVLLPVLITVLLQGVFGSLFERPPRLWYVFPEWPRWIAYAFPTYWLIDPIVRVGQQRATLADVAWQLAVGAAICAVLVPVLRRLAERVRAPVAA